MMKMEPPTIYVPIEMVEDVKKLLLVFQRLDRGRQTADIRGVVAGDEIELSRENVVTVFDTVHTVPSRGFVVWDRRHKLNEEFVGLPGEKIRDLKLSGVAITREVRVPLVAYTGDTAPAGLDACPACYDAKVLITEMSFIREKHRREKIHKFGHMHLDDFVERAARFKNELIVVSHFSTRYHPDEVLRLLDPRDNRLPAILKRLWI